MTVEWIAAAVVAAIVLIAALTAWSMVRERREEQARREVWRDSRERDAQPASLHPRVDLERCIGSGTCVQVCPEETVLAVIDGKARLAEPTSCMGHGECMRACPVDAIQLVMGTEKRGVDLPLVSKNYESDVPGLYIVGELGGMGLIYNAMNQALQCMESLERDVPPPVEGAHQVAIVGAGPAGIAASLAAIEADLDFVTVDQESLGGTVLHYPRHKVVMTRPVTLPLYGKLRITEVTKEELLDIWRDIVEQTGLSVREGVKVEGVDRDDGVFTLHTTEGPLRAQRVVLAMGRRGSPRKLGIPGEDLGKVTYRLIDAEQYAGARCLVVGGGNSGVEAAIALGEAGAEVHLVHRRTEFSIKRQNKERLHEAVEAGRVQLLLEANAREIHPDSVEVDVAGERVVLPNDYVLVFIGGLPPTTFLEESGVHVKTFRGEAFAPANR